ncbi:acyl-CoA thioesterase [Aestuariibacter halophilus]|uniref:Acyl-CoA thioesterase n=1 Tax=Fluctibacter halophilus TaxID=226011 RepID=A0ABS8GB62_9ALTE|nr:thioesterase family protein [Aestuariibacter halophilus]MCC2617628.1 acyl-CoA thioesterase [Aestuariibacter halophilus]
MLSETFKVRFCETDGLAHVSNTVIVAWFETAREDIFRIFTPTLSLDNWPLILASYQVDFHQQLFYGSPVEVRTYVSRMGNSSFDTYQEVWQNGQKCASGTTTLVHFDYEANKAAPITAQQREALSQHLKETA